MTSSAAGLARIAAAGPVERRRLALGTVLGFLAVAASGGLLITSGYLISRAAQRPDILKLTVAITGVRAFAIARALLRYGERLASHDAALRLLGRVRARFYSRLVPLVPADVGGPHSGDLLARFVGDVDSLQDLYVRAFVPTMVAALVVATASLTAFFLLPAAAPVVFVCLLLAATAIPALTALLSWRAAREQAPARAALTTELVETIEGAPELAVAGQARRRIESLRTADRRLAQLGVRHALAGASATGLASLMTGVTVVAVLVVGIPAVRHGTLAGVLLASIVFLVFAAYEAIAPVSAAAQRLRACAKAVERLDALCERAPSVSDPAHPLPLPGCNELRLDHVSLEYDHAVLRDVSLRLRAGEHVALLGPSGVGKTTLAQLLVRFRDPTSGRVTLGGTDLRDLAQDDVRRAVVLGAQDAQLFNTTIRQNLLLARPAADEDDLWDALAAAHAEEFVAAFDDGLDTFAGQDGQLLSGGQRQRIALARALLADAAFLVLDEPTTHLDADTAEAVMSALPRVAGSRGLLVITHSDAGLDDFDAVYELRAGSLARGNPGAAARSPA